jgi:hypothetical protein
VLGGLTISPALELGTGYDSAPNGAARGAARLLETPSVIVADTELGLGAYAAGNFQQYPQDSSQNIAGGTFAVGERAVLPTQTVTAGAAYLDTQLTGFSLTTAPLRRPIAFTVVDARADDQISLGLFTLTPEISASRDRFSKFSGQNHVDAVESLLTEYASDGPGKFVLLVHATQSRYQTAGFNADTGEALAGVEDEAPGLWTIRLLAGAAHRAAAVAAITAPVLEASADWRPTDLDQLRLSLAREIDDPDQVSAAPYTLSQAKLSLAHEYLRNVIFTASASVSHADYLRGSLRETLFGTDTAVAWHLSAALAVDADYAFNDRQANFLRAANEHVVAIGITWTP